MMVFRAWTTNKCIFKKNCVEIIYINQYLFSFTSKKLNDEATAKKKLKLKEQAQAECVNKVFFFFFFFFFCLNF